MRSNRDVAHLGYVELFTPRFAESLSFFTELLSMEIVGTETGSAYLRTWDDYERFSIKVTERDRAGVGRAHGGVPSVHRLGKSKATAPQCTDHCGTDCQGRRHAHVRSSYRRGDHSFVSSEES